MLINYFNKLVIDRVTSTFQINIPWFLLQHSLELLEFLLFIIT